MDVEEGEALYRDLWSHLEAGRLREARAGLERYLAEFRDDWEVRLELAHALFQEGDLEAARDQLAGLAAGEGTDPRVHRALGAVLGQLGAARDEAACYERGGDLDHPAVLFNLGLQAFERKDAGALRRLVGRLRDAGGEPGRVAWLEALQAEERGDFEAAAAAYGVAAREGVAGWLAAYNLARAQLALGRHQEALETLARTRGPGCEERWEPAVVEALAHQALGDLEGARTCLAQAVSRAPTGEVLPAYDLGTLLLECDRPAEAATVLEAAAASAPEDRDLRLALARAHFSAGGFSRAAEVYAQIVAEDPQHFRALYNLAFSQERVGRDEEALETYERALKLRPGHHKTLNKLSRLQLKARNLERAIHLAERSLAVENQENSEGYLALAQALRAALRFQEAARCYEEAGRREPRNPSVWKDLAFCQRQLADPAAAKESAKRAHALQADDPEVLIELGLAYLELGSSEDLAKSRKAFQDALRRAPGSGKALAGLAQVAARVDPPELAVKAAEEALAAGGGYRAHAALGEALLRGHEARRAVDAFKRCLSRNRGYWPACEGIAAAYAELGEAAKHEKYLRLARQLQERRGEIAEGDATGVSTLLSQTSSVLDPNPGGD